MSREWNELNKSFQSLISKKETFEAGKSKLIELRKNIYDMIMTVKNGFNPNGYSLMPFPDAKGYASKTMAYCVYHAVKTEDIVCHVLLKNDEQVFDRGDYQKRLNIDIKTTGNELKNNELVSFSKQINLDELFNYFKEVFLDTNEYIANLEFKDLKTKVAYKSEFVSKNDAAVCLIEKLCNKNTSDYLKTTFSKHWIIHTDAFLKIKNEIVKQAKKQVKNKISVCGLSCNHCFLGQWCGSCRSEYNCCSYGTLFEGGICPNVKCACEKNLEGCYNCSHLDLCEIGFYSKTNHGSASAKASAMFIRKYGKKRFAETLDKMHKQYDFSKMQELIGQDCIEGLDILESFINE